MTKSQVFLYKDNNCYTYLLVAASILNILFNITAAIVFGWFSYLLKQFEVTQSDAIREQIVTLSSMGGGDIFLATDSILRLSFYFWIFCFVLWMFRATKNLRSYQLEKIHYQPLLAAFSILIPLGNLFLPIIYIRNLWKGSSSGVTNANWQSQPTPHFLIGWWLLFVATLLLSKAPGVYLNTLDTEPSLDVRQQILMWAAIGQLALIIPQVMFCYIVTKINKKQILKNKVKPTN